MLSTDIPRRLQKIWASGASGTYVRTVPFATSGDPNAASYQIGFPPNTFTDEGAGGSPPDGRDFNGFAQDVSAWALWHAAGGPVFYDSAFATAIGGYPKYAVLASTTLGRFWQAQIDGVTSDPDAGASADWSQIITPYVSAVDYYYAPGGKIEQWGQVSYSSTVEPVVSVSLPTPYGNGLYNISVTGLITVPSILKDTFPQIIQSSISTTGFDVQYQRTGSTGTSPGLDGFHWRTIGTAP